MIRNSPEAKQKDAELLSSVIEIVTQLGGKKNYAEYAENCYWLETPIGALRMVVYADTCCPIDDDLWIISRWQNPTLTKDVCQCQDCGKWNWHNLQKPETLQSFRRHLEKIFSDHPNWKAPEASDDPGKKEEGKI